MSFNKSTGFVEAYFISSKPFAEFMRNWVQKFFISHTTETLTEGQCHPKWYQTIEDRDLSPYQVWKKSVWVQAKVRVGVGVCECVYFFCWVLLRFSFSLSLSHSLVLLCSGRERGEGVVCCLGFLFLGFFGEGGGGEGVVCLVLLKIP